MAAAVSCDKCGETNNKMTDFIHIRTYTLTSPTTFNNSALEHFDLCTKCYDKIFNFKEEK